MKEAQEIRAISKIPWREKYCLVEEKLSKNLTIVDSSTIWKD